ncbi:MAG: arylsulfatase [candidate division NC10 bacterium]|nr:arylsulfatase [candidate division NC10 bacterium]
MSKRIVLIHAVTVSLQPILEAFKEGWPEAEVSNLLDDGLTGALSREGGLTPPIVRRICDLAVYAERTGADGILFSCSAFTPAMDVAKQLVSIPVLKPDEAMIAAALDAGRRIGVLATLPATAPIQAAQLQAAAAERGKTIQVETAAVPEALKALNAGDTATHDRLVAEAAERLAPRVDVICLAQFSMARARPAVKAKVGVPILTSPSAAVARLKAILTGSAGA